MSTYRKEWVCCGDATETESWEPEECPFCSPGKREAELRKREWQPIQSINVINGFDVWSDTIGRVTNCSLGKSTYGRKSGICYQSGYDSDGPVFDIIDDATHWMPLPAVPAGGEDDK